MDELDRRLIGLLQQDGRAPSVHLARQLGVSEGTVRRRRQRLTQDGVIRVVAVPDPTVFGHYTEALLGIQADPDKIEALATQLSAMEETQWTMATAGAYDLFVWITVGSSEHLESLLYQKIGSLPGVTQTQTFMSLAVMKRAHFPSDQPRG